MTTMDLPAAGNVDKRPHMALSLSMAIFVGTFLLTRHIQLPMLQGLVGPWVLLVLVCTVQLDRTISAVLPMLMYASVSLIGAAFAGHEPSSAARFFIILLATLLAFNVRPRRLSLGWALAPVGVQALLIAGFSLALAILQDSVLASTARFTALENGWGDIYSFNGIYYRVQIIGNALIPLMFLICLFQERRSRANKTGLVISSLGIIAAGNLTYFIVVFIALAVRYWRVFVRRQLLWLLLIPISIAVTLISWQSASELVESKFDGSGSSMGVRFDQVDTAFNSFAESPTAMLIGQGLGAKFPNGRERNYSEHQYIELQVLYMTYQLGILGMLLYVLTLIWCARRHLTSQGQWIFWLFMLSGITNPYILDSNQVIATMMLMHLYSVRMRK
jgi:hypothetical protein